MMVISHTCVNAAAGRMFRKPSTALFAGFLGHAILDLVPHKDVSAHKAEGLLSGIMLAIVGTSCGFKSAPFWCAVGGILPDVEQVLPWTDPARGRPRWFPTHRPWFHSLPLPGHSDYRVGLLAQGAVSTAALLLSITRCRK